MNTLKFKKIYYVTRLNRLSNGLAGYSVLNVMRKWVIIPVQYLLMHSFPKKEIVISLLISKISRANLAFSAVNYQNMWNARKMLALLLKVSDGYFKLWKVPQICKYLLKVVKSSSNGYKKLLKVVKYYDKFLKVTECYIKFCKISA